MVSRTAKLESRMMKVEQALAEKLGLVDRRHLPKGVSRGTVEQRRDTAIIEDLLVYVRTAKIANNGHVEIKNRWILLPTAIEVNDVEPVKKAPEREGPDPYPHLSPEHPIADEHIRKVGFEKPIDTADDIQRQIRRSQRDRRMW